MNTGMLLEMAADGMGERAALGTRDGGLTYAGLLDQARRVASVVAESGAARLVSVGRNSALLPALLFGSGLAGVPFVPVNYRLADGQLRSILSRTAPAVAVVDDDAIGRVADVDGLTMLSPAALAVRMEAATPTGPGFADPDDIAVLLYTSGTTGEPKAAVPADDGKLRIIAFGAHPDDCDLGAGGLAAKYAAHGDKVKFVSLTNGDAGHQSLRGEELARRRRADAACSEPSAV